MAKRKYDEQLKKAVIETVLEGERPAAQVARDYEVPTSAVYSWIRAHKHKHGPIQSPSKDETLEQEVKRLKKELKQAKLEREILEKATAYFAALDK